MCLQLQHFQLILGLIAKSRLILPVTKLHFMQYNPETDLLSILVLKSLYRMKNVRNQEVEFFKSTTKA